MDQDDKKVKSEESIQNCLEHSNQWKIGKPRHKSVEMPLTDSPTCMK